MTKPVVEIDLDAIEAAAARGATLDFPDTALSQRIDRFIDLIGEVVHPLWVVLIALIVVNVAMRYALGTNFIAMEEMQWHLYAIGIMFGLGYGVRHDSHIRVDVVAENLSPRRRGWIELLGLTLIMVPLVYVIISNAIPFTTRAFRLAEVSSAPGGLPMRWIIKSVIILAFAYLGLALVSRLLRVSAFLFGHPKALRP
jgi:TRAP-type mannitol/chloroaromatic compound transport system permease small subunit